MRQTLALIIGAAMPLLAGAQNPPEPRRVPTPRPAPEPRVQEPRPARPPREPSSPRFDFNFDFNFDSDMLRHDIEMMKSQAFDAARMADIELHMNRPEIERAMELAQADVHLKVDREMDRMRFEAERMKFDADRIRFDALEMAKGVDFSFSRPSSEKFLNSRPRAAWSSEDPADSLYRVARETLNRGEWRRAAQLFSDVVKKYPRSEYVVSSSYWEAFSRYRAGTTDDLRAALKILDDGKEQFSRLSRDGDSSTDYQALRARVLSALAARGDEKAAEEARRAAATGTGCDREEISVRAEALSALGQMDAATALPIVRKVLARRDECSTELRRRALYVAGRQTSPEVASIMLDVAKNDPDNSIRGEAMRWLPRVAGDNAVPQLEDILRTSTDEPQQRMAIQALNAIDSDRARKAVRAIVERNDVAERVRYEAITGLLRERDGRQPSAEEVNYVRGLYTKLEAARLREAVLYSVGRVESPENRDFLLSIVKNQNETSSLRASALQRLGRMSVVTVTEIAKLYDVADTRSLRQQILNALSQRKEDEAVDKMIEIGRKDTDPEIRRYAISLLSRSTNPKAVEFIKNMWGQ